MAPPHRLAKSASAEPAVLLAVIRKSLPSKLPPMDARTIQKLKEQALKKAADLQQQAAQSAKEGLAGARLVAADIARGDAAQAGSRVGGWVQRASSSHGMVLVARVLVGLYFLNGVFSKWETWQLMQSPEVAERMQRWPQHFPRVGFPYFSLAVLLPCALLAAVGVRVLVTAGVLVAYEVADSLQLIFNSLVMLLGSGIQPNELVVKRLAMMGCTALLLAHSIKEQRVRISSYAGLLLSRGSGEQRQPGRAKSAVLLLGRLLMSALFVFVGVSQLQRVIARDYILARHLPHSHLYERDGHDNNWLLLEFALALPFAVGWKLAPVSRLLAATLAAEAVTCWPFWAQWPTPGYTAHVRLHFFTNTGVAGGLLLAAVTPGQFTLDAVLKSKKKE